MQNLTPEFDGIHKPRQIQLELLAAIEEWRDKVEVIGIQAPCGVGKQAVAYVSGDSIITSANHLIDQASQTYSSLNVLKGAEHYDCNKYGNCSTPSALDVPRCPSCPYLKARNDAIEGKKTISNPLSYYYVAIRKGFEPPKTQVIDEAHNLEEMLAMVGEMEFSKDLYNPPKLDNAYAVMGWIPTKIADMFKKKMFKQVEKLSKVHDVLKREPNNFRVEETATSLILYPLKPLPAVMERITKSKTLILLSATLFEEDVKRIANGRSYKFISVPSPIPIENRRILFRPMKDNKTPALVKGWIEQQMEEFKEKGVLCHVTYRTQGELKPLFPGAFANSKSDKTEVMEQFCNRGGLWLAAGCHEGLSFDYEACRLNLIPTIQFADIGDPVVSKKMNMPGGVREYELNALRRLIQQIGRTTRAIDDRSTTIVGDKRFKSLITTYRGQLCQSFLDSIDWGGDALN